MTIRSGRPLAGAAVTLMLGLALSACGGGSSSNSGTTGGSTGGTTSGGTTGGTTSGGTTGGTGGSATADIYVAFDGGSNVGSVDTYSADLGTRLASFDSGLSEGLLLKSGDLFQIGVIGGTPTLRRFVNFATRTDRAYNTATDKEYTYAPMRAPKSLSLAGLTSNVVIVGDGSTATSGEDTTQIPSLHFLSNAVSLQPPSLSYTIPVSAATARTWNVAVDAAHDRLFAAMTNGTVAVYDNVTGRGSLAALGGPAVTPNRFITPGSTFNGPSAKISTNLHGIAYDSASDRLILSDIGSADSNSDGRIFVIDSASTVQDAVTSGGVPIVVPTKVITGSNTRLGNPVDIVLRSDGRLFVAEKANSLILVFNDILGPAVGNIAPDLAVSTSSLGSTGSPESIAVVSGR